MTTFTRLALRALLVLALACTAGFVAQSPASAARHSGPNWVWFGPAGWHAAYGTYGITVLGTGGATLDLGFSSTLCAPGATYDASVRNYFAAQRAQLQRSGWRLQAGRIGHPAGFSATYRRQVLNGTNNTQGARRGQIILDYDFTTNVSGVNYCYQRSIAKHARARSWNGVRRTLDSVQRSLAYSGPGAPQGQNPGARAVRR